jgi:uncharacterized protein YoxC
MKRQRPPYAKRSVWYAFAVLSIVLVVVCVAAGYEIHHLQNQVNGLNGQVNSLYRLLTQLSRQSK